MPEFDYQVLRLTNNFYVDYPKDKYPELLTKSVRPYNCLLIESSYGYYICIPFRSNIQHENAFMFHSSSRSKRTPSGLDYTKIVIVDGHDPKNYINTGTALIDPDEYSEVRRHIDTIVCDANNYINEYIEHYMGSNDIKFKRKYQYSTLKYFHKELGLANTEM